MIVEKHSGVAREGIALVLVVVAIVGVSYQLGASSERRKSEALISAERDQHAQTLHDLRYLQQSQKSCAEGCHEHPTP